MLHFFHGSARPPVHSTNLGITYILSNIALRKEYRRRTCVEFYQPSGKTMDRNIAQLTLLARIYSRHELVSLSVSLLQAEAARSHSYGQLPSLPWGTASMAEAEQREADADGDETSSAWRKKEELLHAP